jgi:hypothetical protein
MKGPRLDLHRIYLYYNNKLYTRTRMHEYTHRHVWVETKKN